MDIGRAFSYVFDDEEWLTVLLIGGLILIVPFFGQIVLIGFLLETARNVAGGSARPLPKWNHLGETFSLGLPGFAIQVAYALPVILICCAFACLGVLGISAIAPREGAGALFLLAIFCLGPLATLCNIVLQPISLAATLRYLQTGSLGEALRVGEALRMVRGDLAGWLMLWLLQVLCAIVGGLGGFFFAFGAAFTGAYAAAVFGHLLGQQLARATPPASYNGYAPPAPPSF